MDALWKDAKNRLPILFQSSGIFRSNGWWKIHIFTTSVSITRSLRIPAIDRIRFREWVYVLFREGRLYYAFGDKSIENIFGMKPFWKWQHSYRVLLLKRSLFVSRPWPRGSQNTDGGGTENKQNNGRGRPKSGERLGWNRDAVKTDNCPVAYAHKIVYTSRVGTHHCSCDLVTGMR